MAGFEPAASRSQAERSILAELHLGTGAANTLHRRQLVLTGRGRETERVAVFMGRLYLSARESVIQIMTQ